MESADHVQRLMMTTGFESVRGLLHIALLGMARSAKPVPERMANAYLLHLWQLSTLELPEDVCADWKLIHVEFSKIAAEGDCGSIAAAAARLGEVTARDFIERVIGMYERVCRRAGATA
jgi:hypothetical protein